MYKFNEVWYDGYINTTGGTDMDSDELEAQRAAKEAKK